MGTTNERPHFRLWNTLGRKVEDFKPLKGKTAGLYTCGPTVYNYAHIGNLRTYIFEDTLERSLAWLGYRVKRVMNITDVGHLTGDVDSGEDKVEKEAREEKKTVAQIVSFYTKRFLDDAKKLNIRVPKMLAPASKHVPAQIALIKELFKRGIAYETDVAVYFDVAKFPAYGKLSGQSLEEKLVGARKEVVTDPAKRGPADFALWFKLVGKFEHHIQHWPSPWGEGFPGWHVECSAISRKFLGQPFDIHTGGVDHIGTHHENEIAQSEGAYGVPLARYWLHGEFLLIDAAKMAKSQGNFFTLADIEEKKIHPLAFRYFVLGAHYRTPLNFSWSALEQAKQGLAHLAQKVLLIAFLSRGRMKPSVDAKKEVARVSARFRAALADDLNLPQALAAAHELASSRKLVQSAPKEVLKALYSFDEVLGLDLKGFALRYAAPRLLTNEKLAKLLAEREHHRAYQQFVQSDSLRKKINALGFMVEDTPKGPHVYPTAIL